MNVAKHLCGSQAKSGLPQASRVAVKADLSAPSFSALDRIGSSLRHCYGQKNGNGANDLDCGGEWEDLLKKLS